MGRDVTGIRNDMKPNGVTSDRVHVAPTIATDVVEPEQALSTANHNLKGKFREEVQENQEVLTIRSSNIESGVSNGIRAKIEALKPKLSVKASPGLKPSPVVKPTPEAESSESIKLSTPKAQPSEEEVSGSSESMKISTPKAQPSQEVSDSSESTKISTPKARPSQEVLTDIASDISNASEVETNNSTNSPMSKKNDMHSSMANETTQPQSPSIAGKSLQSDTEDKPYDEDDNYSFASSGRTSSRSAAKFKPTVPVGPKFVCGERVARRKEYYLKLEEKQKALEAERLAEQARIKEAEEAELKKLRRSMTYKANPVPNFYREGPPPKTKLKKFPLTRPKSPNLTRAKSFSDAPKSVREERKSRGDVARHSTGSATATAPKNKDRSLTKTGSKKVRAGQEKNTRPSEIDSDKSVLEGKNTSPTAEQIPNPSTVIDEDATKA